jgi:hypothetical protein
MLNRTLRNMVSFSLMAVMALVMVGCKSTPSMQRHDVTVALAEDVSAGSDTYTVYLVGVGGDELYNKMQATSVDDFIRREDLRRLSPTTTFTLNKDNSSPKTLEASSKMWDDWEKAGVMNLFVIADLPDAPADRSPAGDTRRVIIPLASDRWDGQGKLRVTLRRSAINYAPSPLPEKK